MVNTIIYIHIYIMVFMVYLHIYIFLVNQLISLKNTAQFHVVSCPISEKCGFLCNNNLVKKQPLEVFCKKMVFLKKNFKFHRKTCVLDLCKACNFIKKQLQHRCFCVKFATFLRTPILEKICKGLLLWGIHHIRKP